MSIIAFFIIFILAVCLFGLSLIGNIVRAIFGLGRRNHAGTERKQPHTENKKQYVKEQEAASKRKKIIPKNEGEYVDFEE